MKLLAAAFILLCFAVVVVAVLLASLYAFYALTVLSGIALMLFIAAALVAIAAMFLLRKVAIPFARSQWSAL